MTMRIPLPQCYHVPSVHAELSVNEWRQREYEWQACAEWWQAHAHGQYMLSGKHVPSCKHTPSGNEACSQHHRHCAMTMGLPTSTHRHRPQA
jgi:hypothetical protein